MSPRHSSCSTVGDSSEIAGLSRESYAALIDEMDAEVQHYIAYVEDLQVARPFLASPP